MQRSCYRQTVQSAQNRADDVVRSQTSLEYDCNSTVTECNRNAQINVGKNVFQVELKHLKKNTIIGE